MDLIRAHLDLVYSYAAFIIAYLIGSIPFGVIFSKLFGLPDPRKHGSGNPGATNVLRSGNKLAALLTLVFDALKGWAPTFVVHWYSFELGFDDTTVAFVGVSAFVGHLFPVFLLFRGGGKGVATAAGVLLASEPGLGISVLVIWVVVAALFRYSSLASIIAAAFAPFFTLMFLDRPSLSLAVSVMSLLLIWRHWRNIVKLLTGKESRIGEKPDETKPRKRHRRVHKLHDEATPLPPSQRSKGN